MDLDIRVEVARLLQQAADVHEQAERHLLAAHHRRALADLGGTTTPAGA